MRWYPGHTPTSKTNIYLSSIIQIYNLGDGNQTYDRPVIYFLGDYMHQTRMNLNILKYFWFTIWSELLRFIIHAKDETNNKIFMLF